MKFFSDEIRGRMSVIAFVFAVIIAPATSWGAESADLSHSAVQLGSGGALVEGWSLKKYRVSSSPQAPQYELENLTHGSGAVHFAFDREDLGYLTQGTGRLEKIDAHRFLWVAEDDRVRLERRIVADPGKPYLEVTYFGKFKKDAAKFAFIYLGSKNLSTDEETQDRNLNYWGSNTHELTSQNLAKDITFHSVGTPVRWIAATSRYFILSIVAQEANGAGSALIQPVPSGGGRLSMVFPLAGDQFEIPVRVYFGPKDLGLLRETEKTLDHSVDFGWFTVIAYPILQFMNWLNGYLHNYGLAIIVLTLLLKLVTFPLNYKSMKSMRTMADLKPQIDRIQTKFKDNPEAKNKEMLVLMRTKGYNPMAGCLPILIQMPVFFALYRVLYGAVELYQAPFMLWIHDLSLKDPFYVTPLLLTATMWFQQKLSPNTATDPMQRRMFQWMPVFFGILMVTLPSGLTLYMLINAATSIFQQYIFNKKFGVANNVIVTTARSIQS